MTLAYFKMAMPFLRKKAINQHMFALILMLIGLWQTRFFCGQVHLYLES